jgi:hypothetical protein
MTWLSTENSSFAYSKTQEVILSQNRWNTHFLISDNVLIKKYSFSWIEHFLVSSRNTHFLEKKSGCQPQVQNSSRKYVVGTQQNTYTPEYSCN